MNPAELGTSLSGESFSPLRWHSGVLELLDQTLLPREECWLTCRDVESVADAIRRLAVRGAPAIGVAAAYGLVLGLETAPEGADLSERIRHVAEQLGRTRPTAVNLRWALERGVRHFSTLASRSRHEIVAGMLAWAEGVQEADVEANRTMGEHGAALFEPGDRVLTHCNAGALATAGYGTAVGVITSAFRRGALSHVWVDETRPLLQGARLTAWELERLGIPFRVITDSSAGALFSRGLIDRVVVGADRIAANGDTANKIGTYTVAVLAHRHGVPFYVAAPLSTIDSHTPTGTSIPIEERSPDEVHEVFGTRITPAGAAALNLAFDVTPHELIAAIITEAGVLRPPFTESIARAFSASRE